MRRSKSMHLTLLPWLAFAALAQTQVACAAARKGDSSYAGSDVPPRRDPEDCFADRKDDDDCDGPARRIVASGPDAGDLAGASAPPATDDSTLEPYDYAEIDKRPLRIPNVLRAPVVAVFRGGFGHYFWSGGG